MIPKSLCFLLLVGASYSGVLKAQNPVVWDLPATGDKTLVHEGWYARNIQELGDDGCALTSAPFRSAGWIPATVPGTVLTTLLDQGFYSAPEVSLNNERIPDIARVGRDFYTYWFACPFVLDERWADGQRVWLNFRGINYKAELFLNGKLINRDTHEGMFLRQSYEVTSYLLPDTVNLLAVLVYPPDHVGNPNGGQGGDGQIARNCTMQYTPGWDWIQPVRDRNTGIWDEVSLTVTGDVLVNDPYVVTKVPGVRDPQQEQQKPAYIHASVEVENLTASERRTTVTATTGSGTFRKQVVLQPFEKRVVAFDPIRVKNPELWWPNGIGDQPLQQMRFTVSDRNGTVSDSEDVTFGIRQIETQKNPDNGGREFYVNGQRIYVTGGNYINSDWLLRLSPERYDHEVRFHAEMNLRMIRVWGGALLERPEFYEACDKYGLLVFQDLWGSADCNGAWEDATKAHSRQRRWEYPDNHSLYLEMAEDQIKMIRNHPSLCLWCGANEWPLAKDIDRKLKEEIFPKLDPNRLFISYSTDSAFTHNYLKDVGDGPYLIQEPEWFFTRRSHPFNPELGSVGSPEVESFRAFMNEKELKAVPRMGKTRNRCWDYHRDLGYGDQLERYGAVNTIEDYCRLAQVVNYDQYRSFMEGWASRMWDWYTGILIWKTQNPWTSLRGQMYDWYLDVNASFYGTKKGCEPLHPFYNLANRKVMLLNTSLQPAGGLTVRAELYDRMSRRLWNREMQADAPASEVQTLFEIPVPDKVTGVYFLKLTLLGQDGRALTDNIYWLTTTPKDFRTLSELPQARPEIQTRLERKDDNTWRGQIQLTAGERISFFNRIKVFDRQTGQRILPVHYSDNYITLMPGDSKTVAFTFDADLPQEQIAVVVEDFHDR